MYEDDVWLYALKIWPLGWPIWAHRPVRPCRKSSSDWCLAGNGWDSGNGMIITSDCGSFPHSLRLAPVSLCGQIFIPSNFDYVIQLFESSDSGTVISGSKITTSGLQGATPAEIAKSSNQLQRWRSKRIVQDGLGLVSGAHQWVWLNRDFDLARCLKEEMLFRRKVNKLVLHNVSFDEMGLEDWGIHTVASVNPMLQEWH